jgi:hypothetical protein
VKSLQSFIVINNLIDFATTTAMHLKSITLCFLAAVSCIHGQESKPSIIHYEDFGARGDGTTDDFEALVKAHEHANLHKLPIQARNGAIYRIGGASRCIPIETDTDFGTAKFIIDDTTLEKINSNIFQIRSIHKPLRIKNIKKMDRGQIRIECKLPSACLVIAKNKNVKHFIRRGSNANLGSPQTDIFLVDAAGNVDPSTPIIWDFKEITSLEALPIDKTTLTIKGGIFTTIAHNPEKPDDYVHRGILVQRSNVVIEGLKHLLEAEEKNVAPYMGFVKISGCAHVEVRNSIFTSRRESVHGSYDINLHSVVNSSMINCTQSNSITEEGKWGVMASNFCKNLVYERCKLSRFDAHQGIYNATIRDSEIGSRGITLTGGGVFLLENTKVLSAKPVSLRPDYGSTWDGEFIIRNCRFEPKIMKNKNSYLITGANDGQHDFGYKCQMPSKITIDGLHIEDVAGSSQAAETLLFDNLSPKWIDDSYTQPYPYTPTSEVILSKITTTSGKPILISKNNFMLRDIKVRQLK